MLSYPAVISWRLSQYLRGRIMICCLPRTLFYLLHDCILPTIASGWTSSQGSTNKQIGFSIYLQSGLEHGLVKTECDGVKRWFGQRCCFLTGSSRNTSQSATVAVQSAVFVEEKIGKDYRSDLRKNFTGRWNTERKRHWEWNVGQLPEEITEEQQRLGGVGAAGNRMPHLRNRRKRILLLFQE